MARLRVLDGANEVDRAALAALCARAEQEDPAVEAGARAIVDEVRLGGGAALERIARRLDPEAAARLDGGRPLELSRDEWNALADRTTATVRAALERAHARIRRFHEAEARALAGAAFSLDDADGAQLALRLTPLHRAGLYVPGGTARYPSSVLMTAVPARVAGVDELVMVTPGPSPETLHAARVAGVDRVFVVGGAHAVAALAYGAGELPRVDKIVGPGNAWVAAAKRIVFGQVAIDQVAGPSEVLVVADGDADPRWIAADLLAQAEHDAHAYAVVVTPSAVLARAVADEVTRQLERLPRRAIAEAAIRDRGAAVVVGSLDEALAFAERFAPEHLELAVAEPRPLAARVRAAGAIFVGAHTPEAAGDYFAGPNHVLPTGGAARFGAPLGVHDFWKRTSLVEYAPRTLAAHAPDIEALAAVEGLDAHAEAVRVRLDAARQNDAAAQHGHAASQHVAPLGHLHAWRARVRPALAAAAPYEVPTVDAAVKLDANESPFPLPREVRDAVAAALAEAPLHRYPDPRATALRALVARDLGQPGERLLLGNGADEIIMLLCSTFAAPAAGDASARIVYPAPSFVVYRMAAAANGLDVVEAPLGPRFAPDEEALDRAIRAARPSLVFLTTPNNPTGTVWPRAAVERLVAAHPHQPFIIDQAYVAYGGDDLLDLVGRHSHCAVLRTYSKVGLAGLRLGVLVGQEALVAEVEKVRPPYDLSVLAQRAGEVVLERFRPALDAHTATVVAERERLAAALAARPAIEVFPSGANLVLARFADARAIWRGLAERGVLVRNLDRPGALAGCLRITVGTPAENDRLLAALDEVLASQP